MKATNRAASIRARLLNRARIERTDFNLMLTRYSLERLLYRLSVSPWAEEFLLKGALLFDLWFDQPHRPTRDIDLMKRSCCKPSMLHSHAGEPRCPQAHRWD
jgi:hypothetical protein